MKKSKFNSVLIYFYMLMKVVYSTLPFSMTISDSLFLFINNAILMKMEQSERIYLDHVSQIFIVFLTVPVFAIES
jgi:hypothetical protein